MESPRRSKRRRPNEDTPVLKPKNVLVPPRVQNNPYKFVGGDADKLGEGAFGVVHLALDQTKLASAKNRLVAVKRMNSNMERSGVPQDAYREIKLLKELGSLPPEQTRNIVGLKDIQLLKQGDDLGSVHLVYQLAEHDLSTIIKCHKNESTPMDPRMIKSIIWQVLKGVNFLHNNWIMHRDIKPANLLVLDAPTAPPAEIGCVQLADFGLARIFSAPLRPLGSDGEVVTIWYRAPELLLGSQHYTQAIDIWSVGCILAECFKGKAIFPGVDVMMKNTLQKDQLEKIFTILGPPTAKVWPEVTSCKWFPDISKWGLDSYTQNLAEDTRMDPSSLEFDLLSRMLHYNPNERITAEDALKHPYFDAQPKPLDNVFVDTNNLPIVYPTKKTALYNQQHSRTRIVPPSRSMIYSQQTAPARISRP